MEGKGKSMKENKFLKSLLASLLAFTAVASSATPVFAEDTAAEPEEAVLEEAPAEAEELPAEELSAEELPAEDLPAEEETVEDQAVEEEKTVSFYQELDDVTVSAEAAANVFPAGTVMTVKKVDDEATLALAAQAVGENATTKVAVDITFICGNDEIQPNGEVRVTISSPEIAELDNPVLVHVDDKQEEVTPEVVDQIDETTPAEEVTANLDSFSVYAVVDDGDTGDNARVKVNFYGKDKTTVVATYYVKNDDTAEELKIIVSDPNIGELDDKELFRGWTTDKDYTINTTPVDIDTIRADLAARSIEEGDEVSYYAMIFKYYTITYVGTSQDKAALGSATVVVSLNQQNGTYKINMPYTPATGEQNFEGWNVREEDKGNIVSATFENEPATEPYKNGTELVIKGDVELDVDAPYGKWLIFHEEGGTYVAPQFVKNGKLPKEPLAADMKKNGYTFAGWYTAAEGGTEFNFNNELSENPTDIYAHWTINQKANYAVIVWEEKANDDGYDYADSKVIEATVGSTITVTTSGSNVYVNSTQTDYTFTCDTGFSYFQADVGKTVAAEGNTIVNIYIKRNVYDLIFQTANGTTIKTISAKFEQDISGEFPIVGSNGITYPTGTRWNPQRNLTVDGQTYFRQNVVVAYIDIMTPGDMTFRYSSNPTDTGYAERTMNYWIETVAGTTPTGQTTTYKNKTYELRTQVKAVYYGVTIEDFIDLPGFEHFEADKYLRNNYYRDTNNNNGARSTVVNFYYSRMKYDIVFMDGSYFDGEDKDGSPGNPITPTIKPAGQWKDVKEITYGADVSSYNAGGANYFDPTTDSSTSSDSRLRQDFVFAGWYVDETCTIPYTFDTMPKDGIMVYAKWRQKQYRVFLHPNAGEGESRDESLDWGSDDQEMNFRIPYGGKVSLPDGTRTGYEMVGWFTDEALEDVFNANNVPMTDATTNSNYNKTTDFTDDMDKWGTGATYNKDVDRFWVKNKLDLYVKWRETTEGADGIGVSYDAMEGTNPPTSDTNLYVDTSKAVAQSASTPPEGKVFAYWAVWNFNTDSDTGVHVYPGDTFEVLKSNSEIITIDENTKKYTVYLKAVYAEAETPEPTHIWWFANYGDNAFVKENTVDGETAGTTFPINFAVDIKEYNTFTRDGYIFLGWARVDAVNDAEAAPLHEELGADDLFLKWENEKWYAHDDASNPDSAWFEVTSKKVAADERQPYHDLYAVWQKTFKIDHSSSAEGVDVETYTTNGYKVVNGKMTNEVGDIVKKDANNKPILDNNGVATFDLTKAVRNDHFYGGYYSARPAAKYEGGRGLWDQENYAYTEYGTQFKPGTESVYYLKEVPVKYLQPYTQYVYNKSYDNVVCGLYMITAVDDDNYDAIGTLSYKDTGATDYIIYKKSNPEEYEFKFTMKYTLKPTTTSTPSTILNANTVLGVDPEKEGIINSPIAVWNVTEMINEGVFDVFATPSDRPPVNGLKASKDIKLAPYVETPDHIGVSMSYRVFHTTSSSTVRPEFTYRSDLTNPENRENVSLNKTVWYQEVNNN